MNNISMLLPPTYVGGYRIGSGPHNVIITLTTRPSWFHRKMMKWAFGWEWVENGDLK